MAAITSYWTQPDPVALQRLAIDAVAVVVAVDYRRAPEAPFPAALNVSYATLRWVHSEAIALGLDRTRIAVTGESAGGDHAAALAIAARDRGEVAIAFQLLIYPMLDDRVGADIDPPPHVGRHVWTRASIRVGWTSHLGHPAGAAETQALAVPARIVDPTGLPPVFVGCGGLDLFVDENVTYASD